MEHERLRPRRAEPLGALLVDAGLDEERRKRARQRVQGDRQVAERDDLRRRDAVRPVLLRAVVTKPDLVLVVEPVLVVRECARVLDHCMNRGCVRSMYVWSGVPSGPAKVGRKKWPTRPNQRSKSCSRRSRRMSPSSSSARSSSASKPTARLRSSSSSSETGEREISAEPYAYPAVTWSLLRSKCTDPFTLTARHRSETGRRIGGVLAGPAGRHGGRARQIEIEALNKLRAALA